MLLSPRAAKKEKMAKEGIFSFVRRSRLEGGHGAAQPLLVRPGVLRLVSILGASGLMKKVKGWRRF
jgi:hypothetical protein